MEKWKQIYLEDDAEVLTDGKIFIKVVWGWTTEGVGHYNEFKTDTTVSKWVGDPDEFSPDIPEYKAGWERITGFDHEIEGVDSEDMTDADCDRVYKEELSEILKDVSRGFYD